MRSSEPHWVTGCGSAGKDNAVAHSIMVGIMQWPGSAFEAPISSEEHVNLATRLPAPAAGTDTTVQEKRHAEQTLLPTDKTLNTL